MGAMYVPFDVCRHKTTVSQPSCRYYCLPMWVNRRQSGASGVRCVARGVTQPRAPWAAAGLSGHPLTRTALGNNISAITRTSSPQIIVCPEMHSSCTNACRGYVCVNCLLCSLWSRSRSMRYCMQIMRASRALLWFQLLVFMFARSVDLLRISIIWSSLLRASIIYLKTEKWSLTSI